ncbi:MAG: hypothetical protein ABSA46_16170 [Thermodesulfovibrionales bacterium]
MKIGQLKAIWMVWWRSPILLSLRIRILRQKGGLISFSITCNRKITGGSSVLPMGPLGYHRTGFSATVFSYSPVCEEVGKKLAGLILYNQGSILQTEAI